MCWLSPSLGKLGISPEDPRWIGAWWAGFLLCGALLFFSALLMFGFPQSLPLREGEDGGQESEQAMLSPTGMNTEYQMPKPSSNGAAGHHEPANSPTCCQQLRGDTGALGALRAKCFINESLDQWTWR